MDYLKKLERKIEAYDGMLIETGGRFGQGRLGGDKYEESCLEDARQYISHGGNKACLIDLVDKYIAFYEKETQWIFQNLEIAFLTSLKKQLETL